MRVLIIKLSSLGDVIHTLPAITDATKAIPDIQFHWVVEGAFQEVPTWHAAVERVIPVALRQLKKSPWNQRNEISAMWQVIRQERYDCIIDAQGLIKSASLALIARGPISGFDKHSAREPLASLVYQHRYFVSRRQHAIGRLRQLFAKALKYDFDANTVDYGIFKSALKQPAAQQTAPIQPAALEQPAVPIQLAAQEKTTAPKTVFFLHGTTWDTKHWPAEHWVTLARLMREENVTIKIPWGNEVERERALVIAKDQPHVTVLPKSSLTELAQELAMAHACVAVDTGLGHLAAALNVPTVSLYGPTDAMKTGTVGFHQTHFSATTPCAPCLSRDCRYPQDGNMPPCLNSIEPVEVMKELIR